MPGAHEDRGTEGRDGAAELVRPPHRGAFEIPRQEAYRLGRDPRGRPGARGDRDVVARHGRRHRGGAPGARRGHGADDLQLYRLLSGRLALRAAGHRRFRPAGENLWLRAGPSPAQPGRGGAHPRWPGQPLDRVCSHPRASFLYDVATAGRPGRGAVEPCRCPRLWILHAKAGSAAPGIEGSRRHPRRLGVAAGHSGPGPPRRKRLEDRDGRWGGYRARCQDPP